MIHQRLSAILIAILLLASFASSGWADQQGRVCWISDGDTISVEGVGVVRLIGIDCPEKVESDRDWHYLRLGSCDWNSLRDVAESARLRVMELCLDKRVRLVTGEQKYDRYGRLLAYVWLPDGRMLNQLMLEEGRAIVYRRFDFAGKETFLKLEGKARNNRLGMWRNPASRS
jgi:micrococcal nuclease